MNRKSIVERAKIIQLLVEGNSIRATSRIIDCSKCTVIKLLVDVGTKAEAIQPGLPRRCAPGNDGEAEKNRPEGRL